MKKRLNLSELTVVTEEDFKSFVEANKPLERVYDQIGEPPISDIFKNDIMVAKIIHDYKHENGVTTQTPTYYIKTEKRN